MENNTCYCTYRFIDKKCKQHYLVAPKKWKITQRHEDCHYETCIKTDDLQHVFIGYGVTQQAADIRAIEQLLKAYEKE